MKQNGIATVDLEVKKTEVLPTADAKYTANLNSRGEISLTLRTNDVEELEPFFERWESRVIILPDPKEQNDQLRYYPGQTCPKCSNKLVRRQGRNGKFTGCSNYPECQFTSAI